MFERVETKFFSLQHSNSSSHFKKPRPRTILYTEFAEEFLVTHVVLTFLLHCTRPCYVVVICLLVSAGANKTRTGRKSNQNGSQHKGRK